MTYEISGKQAGRYEASEPKADAVSAASTANAASTAQSEGAEEGLTERDVLLGLVMEALSGGPVDVVATVTALGFVEIVEVAKTLIDIENEEDATTEEEDPDATPLDDSASAAEVAADNASDAGGSDEGATSDGGDSA